MQTRRCIPCQGSGYMMGGGMIRKHCDECNGKGIIKFDIDKAKKTYQDAKKKIRKADKNITDAEAEKMIDDEIAKCR